MAKQLKKNGLTKKSVRFTDKALAKIIDGYTMEAGVRELERMIAAVLRKVVRKNYTVGGVNIEKQIVITDKMRLALYVDLHGQQLAVILLK